MGRTCWSLAALQQFPCYDESKPMTYWFTFGSRANDQIAAATDVAPGRFTRIALLAPLDLPERPATLPPLLVERQRSVAEPFMGEALILPKRHAKYDVKWPSPMRGVNSWHSDGYAWATQQPQSMLGGWHYGRHCLLAPSTDVSAVEPGATTNDPPVTVTVTTHATVEVSPPQRTLVNCQVAWGQLLTNLAPTLHKFNWAGYAQNSLGTGADPNWLQSSFSAWDVYVGTSPYAVEETYPAPATIMGDHVTMRQYAKDRALDINGVTNSPISGLPPVPVTIAVKYR